MAHLTNEAVYDIERLADILWDLDGHIMQALDDGQHENEAFANIERMIGDTEVRHDITLTSMRDEIREAKDQNEASKHELDRRQLHEDQMLTLSIDSIEYEEAVKLPSRNEISDQVKRVLSDLEEAYSDAARRRDTDNIDYEEN